MQRMTWRRLRTDDDGAVAIIFALMLMPMLAIAALVVDIGASYTKKFELQNATDAAALAIAQDCVRRICGDTTDTARSLTAANAGAQSAVTTVVGTSSVTVRASATVAHWFAPAIGVESSDVGAASTARWGAPSGATTVLPLVFSWCSFEIQTGGGVPNAAVEHTIKDSRNDGTTCTGPSGNAVPGGFGWIKTLTGSCNAASSILNAQTFSDPGKSPNCSTAAIEAIREQTVLLPIFDNADSSGSNAWYHIYAYAAFKVTGYNFGGQDKHPSTPPCKGDVHCISGYFTNIVLDPTAPVTYSADAPNLGASIVALTS